MTSRGIFCPKELTNSSGATIEKFGERLVVYGFQQSYKFDYDKTFATVVKFSALRLLHAIVALADLVHLQMNVKTAFLNGNLNKDIYMKQLKGFVDESQPNHVGKRQKVLYRLM